MGGQNLLKKIYFILAPDEWHGYDTESVWAEEISKNKFRVGNSPFFAKGVSFEDIVATKRINHQDIYDKTLISSGHSTYRLLVKDHNFPEPFNSYWKPIEKLGVSYEENTKLALRMFALDIPPATDIEKVYALLEEGENAGIWDFEEGHFGHIKTKETSKTS